MHDAFIKKLESITPKAKSDFEKASRRQCEAKEHRFSWDATLTIKEDPFFSVQSAVLLPD
jgi:hypothetical protein